MPLQTRLSALISAIKGDFDGLDARITTLEGAGGGSKPAFYLWCEENGGLGSNAYEWSWGNGATGNDIGCPMMVAANLTHMSFNADVFGASVQINARRATSPGTGTIISNPTFSQNNSVFALPTPILFDVGDTLVCQTGAISGTNTDARAFFRFEEV